MKLHGFLLMILALHFLPSSLYAQEYPERTEMTSLLIAIDSLKEDVRELQSDVHAMQTCKDYFSSILNSQTVIFSTIVVVVIAVLGSFSFFRAKEIISREMSQIKSQTEEREKAAIKTIRSYVDDQLQEFKNEIQDLHAEMYRAFATMHDSSPSVAYIWWLRAASWYTPQQKRFIQLALRSAHESLAKIQHSYEINPEIAEIKEMLARLDDNQYDLHKNLIQDELKRILKA